MSGAALMPPVDVAAGLLVLAGVAKLRRPGPLGATLRAIRLPSGRAVVRAVGLVEVVVGLACIARPTAALELTLALVYLAFAGVAATLLATGADLESCGCLGEHDAPPSWVHVAFDLAAAAVVLLAATRPQATLVSAVSAHPAPGLVLGAGIAAGVVLASTVLAALPAAFAAYAGDEA